MNAVGGEEGMALAVGGSHGLGRAVRQRFHVYVIGVLGIEDQDVLIAIQ